MGQYLREEIFPNFGIEMISGMKDEDYAKRVNFDWLTKWKMFKMMWNGPEKDLVAFDFSQAGELEKVNNRLI